MDDITVELGEEVTKDNPSTALLPEPLLLILSPPPPYLPASGEPTVSWGVWLKSFDQYLDALGESDLVDSTKCVLLQHCLGHEGQRVYAALVRGETTYAAATSALTTHFSSGRRPQTRRLEFQQRAQMPGESVEQFVSALQELVKPCNFGDLQDKFILNQLIEKTNCAQFRERLLLEKETLTLAKALIMGKRMESALSESASLCMTSDNVDNGDHPVLAKRGRSGQKLKKIKPHLTITPSGLSGHKDDDYYYTDDKHYFGADDDETDADFDYDDPKDKDFEVEGDVEDDYCGEAKDYNGAEKEETIISNIKTKGHFCPICVDRSFRGANKLARHMRTHTKEKPFSCSICDKTFSQSYHMTRHLRNQHGAGKRMKRALSESASLCMTSDNVDNGDHPVLAKRGRSGQRLKKTKPHLAIIPSGLSGHKDNDCYYTDDKHGADDEETDAWNEQTDADFDYDDPKDKDFEVDGDGDVEDDGYDEAKEYDGAEKGETVISKIKTKEHFCPVCIDRSFCGANKLARHMRTHTKEKPFSCSICAKTFSQSYHMTRHLRNQHGAGQYICSKCGESLGSLAELKTHKWTHVPEVFPCPDCNKMFQKSVLLIHIKSHSKDQSNQTHSAVQLKPRVLICTECGKTFAKKYSLKRHMATHDKSMKKICYECPDCQKSYSHLKDLNKHLEIHRIGKNGTCPKCDQTFSCLDELETHMEIHEKSYLCTICGKKFKVEYALKKHEQGHKEEQHYCSLCDKHFLKLSHYQRHLRVHARRESKCPHCESVFLKLISFKKHLRTHIDERPHQCPCCAESFTQKDDLEQHCLRHRKLKKEKPYSCTRCDYAFSSLKELTAHMSSHKGEKPMNCPDCGKTFLNKNRLERHLSIHTGERPHLCSVCGHGFPCAASLKMHARLHTGDKPFKCSQCSKSFTSSSGLRFHSRNHMAVRPSYPCLECGRTYGRVTELKMHQRYHTGDKPYSCTCCKKCFISKNKLNVHMRKHTGERPYSCSQCGQTFTQAGDRNRHMNKYH